MPYPPDPMVAAQPGDVVELRFGVDPTTTYRIRLLDPADVNAVLHGLPGLVETDGGRWRLNATGADSFVWRTFAASCVGFHALNDDDGTPLRFSPETVRALWRATPVRWRLELVLVAWSAAPVVRALLAWVAPTQAVDVGGPPAIPEMFPADDAALLPPRIERGESNEVDLDDDGPQRLEGYRDDPPGPPS